MAPLRQPFGGDAVLTGYVDVARTGRARTAAACCLDDDQWGGDRGATDAFQSDDVWLRVFEDKGLPEVDAFALRILTFVEARRRPGHRVRAVIGNEPNNPFEHAGVDPAGYGRWFAAVKRQVQAHDATIACWWAHMSPGFDPAAWYAGCAVADGVLLPAYGLTLEEKMGVIRAFVRDHPGVRWGVGEGNHGPGRGRVCDRDVWADQVLAPALAECAQLGAEVYLYFVFDGWTQDDASVGQATPPIARGTRIDRVLRAWKDPPKEKPVPENVNPPRTELVAYARQAASAHSFPPDTFERQVDQESGFRHWDDDGTLVGSSAGAQGITQIVPRYHPDADLSTPQSALDYTARWMGQLLEQYGDVIRSLVHYNGGGGAVAAWAAGTPYAESVQYVDAILGYLTVPQFGGPLEGWGFSADWVGSACGPLAVAGMARALGLLAPPADVLRSAPEHGWTPEGGMNGPANLGRLLRRWRMEPVEIDAGLMTERLWHGRPVIVSTPHHYYLAQRASRTDDEVLVGNSGQARRGGGAWMSLERIAALDGGINALFTAERMTAPVEVVDPLTDATNNVFDLTLTAGPHSEERRRSAQLAIATIKRALVAP